MSYHVLKINNINKLITCTANMIYNLKYISPFNSSQYFKASSFILNEYYKFNNNDWKKYINTSNYNEYGYYKKCINVENYLNNIKIHCNIITWSPGAKTHIHGHNSMGCIMMPIKGYLIENVIYSDIYNSLLLPKSENNIFKSNIITKGNTSYIDDEIGYHCIINESDSICVSIHLYYDYNDINK